MFTLWHFMEKDYYFDDISVWITLFLLIILALCHSGWNYTGSVKNYVEKVG